jgi:hypothetical protein
MLRRRFIRVFIYVVIVVCSFSLRYHPLLIADWSIRFIRKWELTPPSHCLAALGFTLNGTHLVNIHVWKCVLMYVGRNGTQVHTCIRRSGNHFDMNLDHGVVWVCCYVHIRVFLVILYLCIMSHILIPLSLSFPSLCGLSTFKTLYSVLNTCHFFKSSNHYMFRPEMAILKWQKLF